MTDLVAFITEHILTCEKQLAESKRLLALALEDGKNCRHSILLHTGSGYKCEACGNKVAHVYWQPEESLATAKETNPDNVVSSNISAIYVHGSEDTTVVFNDGTRQKVPCQRVCISDPHQ